MAVEVVPMGMSSGYLPADAVGPSGPASGQRATADDHRFRRVIRWMAISALFVLTALGVLFTVGEAMSDPGGLLGAGIAALIVVAIVALGWLAWFRPDLGGKVLTIAVGIAVAADAWGVVSPATWRTVEDNHGPIRAVVSLVLATAVAALSLRRTRLAATLLIVLGLVPALASMVAHGSAPLAVLSAPLLIIGIVLLAASAGRDPRAGP